jgi:hypothetical protein
MMNRTRYLYQFDEIDQDIRARLLQESISETVNEIIDELENESTDDLFMTEEVRLFFTEANPEHNESIKNYLNTIYSDIHKVINIHIMTKFYGFGDIAMRKYKIKMLDYIERHGLPQNVVKSSLPEEKESSTSEWFCNIL